MICYQRKNGSDSNDRRDKGQAYLKDDLKADISFSGAISSHKTWNHKDTEPADPDYDSMLTTKQYAFRSFWRFGFIVGDNSVGGNILCVFLGLPELELLDVQETDQILENDFDEDNLASDCSMYLSDSCLM